MKKLHTKYRRCTSKCSTRVRAPRFLSHTCSSLTVWTDLHPSREMDGKITSSGTYKVSTQSRADPGSGRTVTLLPAISENASRFLPMSTETVISEVVEAENFTSQSRTWIFMGCGEGRRGGVGV